MKLHLFVLAVMIITCSCSNSAKNENGISPELLAKAKGIHERVITLDTHCDINVRNFTDSINYTQELSNQVNLPKMKKGELDVAWFVVYTGQDSLNEAGYSKAYENAMAKFNAIHKLTKEIAPDQIELAVSSNDVRRIVAQGKKVAMIGVENGYPIGTNISRVKQFYDLGARYMSLAHNGHSQLCDSNTGENDGVWLHDGVSELGKQVISEMNTYGMMIDISHPSKEAIRDMIELSKAPIIASHSSARALCDHSRNLDDEQLQWIKKNGGVVQTVAFKTYVNFEKQNQRNKELKILKKSIADSLGIQLEIDKAIFQSYSDEEKVLFREKRQLVSQLTKQKASRMKNLTSPVNVADFVDHIDYLVEKIGIDHVGISSDFDGGGGVLGWNDSSETFNVTLELVRRQYTEEEIGKLWSENLLRVLDEVQKIALEIQVKNSSL